MKRLRLTLRRNLKFILISLLVITLVITTANIAIANTNFGSRGQNGREGLDGRRGINGQDITFFADGDVFNYNLAGSNGEDGSDGTPGNNASRCNHPRRPDYSLQGAVGGNGGRGGNGGDGGNGGNALIYYTDSAALSNGTLNNPGGQGGRGGRGSQGGYGCGCREYSWEISYCRWDLLKKPLNVENASWIFDSSHTTTCQGIEYIDERESKPPLPSRYRSRSQQQQWSFRWEYQGISRTKSFSCSDGRDGTSGESGSNGKNGSYGKVTLVPRRDIPAERVNYSDTISNLLGKEIELVKNIWVNRRGLSSLLATNSNVPDSYKYLQDTARLNYRVDWEAEVTPQEIDVDQTNIAAQIVVNNNLGSLNFDVPGTLEYVREKEEKLEVLTITGGFNPSRVKSFRIVRVENLVGDKSQLALLDEGDLRELLKSHQIEVICLTKQSSSGREVSPEYQERHRIKFDFTPKSIPARNVEVVGNVYTLQLQSYFYPWLKAGYDVEYRVEVTQVTKSNATYKQTEQISFKLPG